MAIRSADHAGQKYYQLTHDYLVHSLARMADPQAEGNSPGPGRAETGRTPRPVERQAGKPPSAVALGMARHPHADGSEKVDRPQRKMMAKAARCTAGDPPCRWLVSSHWPLSEPSFALKLPERQEATRIEGLVGRLVSAEPNQVPDIVKELDANPEVAATYLFAAACRQGRNGRREAAQLHARLALVSRDPSQVEPLVEELLTDKVAYIVPIRQLLASLRG